MVFHKGNTQINKANQAAVKKIGTMADRVAAMAASSSSPSSRPTRLKNPQKKQNQDLIYLTQRQRNLARTWP